LGVLYASALSAAVAEFREEAEEVCVKEGLDGAAVRVTVVDILPVYRFDVL
jgi:hypothetical protein